MSRHSFDVNHQFVIWGYASVYGIADRHNDIINKDSILGQANEIKFLWQHDLNKPIGIIESLFQDDYGLQIKGIINCATITGNEAVSLIKQGAINGLSIGFNIMEYYYDSCGARVITKAELLEISLVTFPANKYAVINYKDKDQYSPLSIALENLEEKISQFPS